MASSRQEYLKRYTSSDSDKPKKKKKKKTKALKPSGYGGAITIVDDDPLWQREIKEESPDEDDQDDAPLVIKDVEVIRMQKMEALKMHRPYLSMADDGSGWVQIDDLRRQELASAARVVKTLPSSQQEICSPKETLQESPDLSPERKIQKDPLGSSSSDKDFGRSQHQSPDLSPPRKGKQDTPDSSPIRSHSGRKRHDSPDSALVKKVTQETHDLSPPRLLSERDHHDSPGLFPPRIGRQEASDAFHPSFRSRRAHNDSPYLSPPRKGKDGAPNLSPPRLPSGRSCHDSQDLSPPRKGRQESLDLSPPRLSSRRRRHETQDLSPPRKGRQEILDLSPQRKDRQENLGSSPPRLPSGRSRHDSPDLSTSSMRKQESLDLSPQRKSRQESLDSSPPRLPSGGSRHDSSDLSPLRKGRQEGLDLFPQRKIRQGTPDLSSEREKGRYAASDLSPTRNGSRKREKMVDGSAAGLQSRGQLVEEIKHRKQEEIRRFSEMDASVSGRAADTVYRDRHGRRLESFDEVLKLQQVEKPKEKPLEWGKGLAQKKEAEAREAELEAEKFKPFARSRDDPDLDKELKERLRWGDPMAHLVKKKTSEPVLEDLGEIEEMRESGFIVPQDIPKHSWLKRGITPPPNRYSIKPGRHWDGVDRSNGFEKDIYKRQNEKKANELEAYLWSVSEM